MQQRKSFKNYYDLANVSWFKDLFKAVDNYPTPNPINLDDIQHLVLQNNSLLEEEKTLIQHILLNRAMESCKGSKGGINYAAFDHLLSLGCKPASQGTFNFPHHIHEAHPLVSILLREEIKENKNKAENIEEREKAFKRLLEMYCTQDIELKSIDLQVAIPKRTNGGDSPRGDRYELTTKGQLWQSLYLYMRSTNHELTSFLMETLAHYGIDLTLFDTPSRSTDMASLEKNKQDLTIEINQFLARNEIKSLDISNETSATLKILQKFIDMKTQLVGQQDIAVVAVRLEANFSASEINTLARFHDKIFKDENLNNFFQKRADEARYATSSANDKLMSPDLSEEEQFLLQGISVKHSKKTFHPKNSQQLNEQKNSTLNNSQHGPKQVTPKVTIWCGNDKTYCSSLFPLPTRISGTPSKVPGLNSKTNFPTLSRK